MDCKQTKHTLMYMPPRKSILLEADHGVGKSDVVAQSAQEMSRILNKPFGFVDFRLAQCEVGDMIGMMKQVDMGTITRMVFVDGKKVEHEESVENVTVHSLADWFPQDPDSCGYLFLDELWRAARDVQNAVLELALDYRYHFKELPMGWRVIAACNDNMDVYAGTQPDAALLNRFLQIKFRPTVPEWLDWAEENGVHSAITNYISKSHADLRTESKNLKPGEQAPTPRSWVSLSECMIYMKDMGQDPIKDPNYFTLLSKGYLGDTVSVNFVDYVANNYVIYEPEDILNKFDKDTDTQKAFKDMPPAEAGNYTKKMVKYIGKSGKLSKKQSENLFLWIKTCHQELASDFWIQFNTDEKTTKIARIWFMNTEGVKDFYGFLNKASLAK